MKTVSPLLTAVLLVSVAVPFVYWHGSSRTDETDEFHFGVTYGFNTTSEAKLLIDKVRNYTDVFVVDSWGVTENETTLNEICQYSADAGLKFVVYFDLISVTTYNWHRDWITTAKTRWGDKFLGIYLHDELGGKQLDQQRYFRNASDFADAANHFTKNIASYYSTQFLKNNSMPIFTSDYAFYWWDYLGRYDTVFA